MDLKDLLSDIMREGRLSMPSFHKSRVSRAASDLASRFTEADEMPPMVEMKGVVARLENLTESDNLDTISRRDWRKASWCLWFEGNELARHMKFLQFFLNKIYVDDRKGQVKKLISAYLRDYSSDKANIRKVGDFLVSRVNNWEWVWAERQVKLGLFGANGPEIFAAHLMNSKETVEDFLQLNGITGDLSTRGFARHSFEKALGTFSEFNNEQYIRLIDRIIDWSVDPDGLRYAGLEPQIADVMLLRWIENTPDKTIQNKIEAYLLTHFKDPRIAGKAGSKWTSVSDDAKSVILRWLVGASLDQFLQVVDIIAYDAQWRYRKAFWKAYYDRGYIDEAWVAFAWQGQFQARQSFGDNIGFGKLDGSGDINHAVLLMKIGGLTIADWSHNGKCHIWTASRQGSPKLYKTAYSRRDLVTGSSNEGEIHTASITGNWQGKIARYIARNTRINLSRQKYMPGRRG